MSQCRCCARYTPLEEQIRVVVRAGAAVFEVMVCWQCHGGKEPAQEVPRG